jgi:hypothetical protein
MMVESLDQYKKQFAKWKWSKYIPAKAGNWMLQKADQRKREEGKDTEFEYRGRSLTETSIQGRIERKKGGPHAQGPLGIPPNPCFDCIVLIEVHRCRDAK